MLRQLLRSGFAPRVIIAEVNRNFPPDRALTVPYRSTHLSIYHISVNLSHIGPSIAYRSIYRVPCDHCGGQPQLPARPRPHRPLQVHPFIGPSITYQSIYHIAVHISHSGPSIDRSIYHISVHLSPIGPSFAPRVIIAEVNRNFPTERALTVPYPPAGLIAP